jgi:DNA-binding NtrC family response regulator
MSLNLLLLEDSLTDAELILDVLRDAGFEVASRRVDSQTNFLRELDQPPDFILSDFSMPQFTARDALRLMQERGLDIPFIVVSGCIGEEMAVECMRAGATDYLLKDRLARLGHSVSQALDRKRLVEDKRQAEQRLFLEAFHDSLTGLPIARYSWTDWIGSTCRAGVNPASSSPYSLSISTGSAWFATAWAPPRRIAC